MKKSFIIILVLVYVNSLRAQNLNNIQFPHSVKVSARKEIRIPDIPGFLTLKCDFHMHTIFSDGMVWPTTRVDEAWEEGLDAIAISDHIENQPSKQFVGGDHNSSYLIALSEAKEKNILLVRAGELTRDMPPGHFNALFMTDVNALDQKDPFKALEAAKNQGAFIQWNHPGWKAQQPDTCLWMDMHQKLFEKGLINGIEVFNEKEYYPIVLDWCLNRNIAVLCNSDIHDEVGEVYDLASEHRPMTLVFASNRNLESLKEAMFENRTLAFFDNKLAGREDLLKSVFTSSLIVRDMRITDHEHHELYELKNISSIPLEIEMKNGDQLIIPAESSQILSSGESLDSEVSVKNFYTGSRTCLHIRLK